MEGSSADVNIEEKWRLFDQTLPSEVKHRLYRHQHDGVKWLHALHFYHSGGGILGDDMGLGRVLHSRIFILIDRSI